ncbi:shikimate kinase [Marixanthomonas spongiae]|nr:shikimate kinase [Marixanthomonas spongiae]
MKIILIGYMGSGKSTVGKPLSEKLNYPYKDLDTEIEHREGKPIASIFAEKGEIYFRKKEAIVLQEILSEKSNMVLATGGGTPCYGTVMDDLNKAENVITVYLKASVEELTARLFPEKETRPLIAHLKAEEDLKDFVRKHLFERAHVYNKADFVIHTDGLHTSKITEKLISHLF